MKLLFTGLGLAALLSLPTAYAGDCTTTFDQSCLASRYNRSQVERDLESKEARAHAEIKAQEEKAEKEAMKARNEEREEKRQQNRDFDERLQTARAEWHGRVEEFRTGVEAINGKYRAPAPSFLDRRSLRYR